MKFSYRSISLVYVQIRGRAVAAVDVEAVGVAVDEGEDWQWLNWSFASSEVEDVAEEQAGVEVWVALALWKEALC